MASLSLWKARMQIAQARCNQDSNRSVFTMKPREKKKCNVPRERTLQEAHLRHNRTISGIEPFESSVIMDGVSSPSQKNPNDSTKPELSSLAVHYNVPEKTRFGEGIVPDEELNRRRVRHYPDNKGSQWVALMKTDLEQYQQNVAQTRAAKLSNQRRFGAALKSQIEDHAAKLIIEKRKQQEEAEQLKRDVEDKEKQELQKKKMQREIMAKNYRFIEEQLRIRREAAEKAEQTKKRLDMLEREALQRKLEKEKLLAEETRRRTRENLQLYRVQNERNMKEKANMVAMERHRDIEEQLRSIAAMEAAELEKRNRIKRIADKTASLERENEIIAKSMQQKRDEEEQRIRKYQEERDEKQRKEELERKRKQKAITEEMKNSIKLQLEERQREHLKQAEEAGKIGSLACQLAAQEMKRQRDQECEAAQRRRQYKAELDQQIQQRDQITHIGFDCMDKNELAINRSLLK